ncbi:transmembrane protein 126A [Danio rerio]|uniref:Transmembrane protein 126A n=1 Tax=Danio rerio TaxID=7955 RepID=A0A2R8QM83_DANRE|nr:transmembrane protein 126A [Danio rerio]NP_957092.2 transmembrane protein 126A [Danio rerio]|eukprot:NP_001315361.1 transmembrane protein 126A [Danio rerio]
MTDNSMTMRDASQGLTSSRMRIIEMLNKKFEKLPESDRKMLSRGPLYLAANAGIAGMVANSFYRRVLHVTQGLFTSSLPMAVLPFVTTAALYTATVTTPLLSGDLNCPTCALIRGALVGVVGGGIYPILLALPVNAGLAARYNSAPMPEKGNIIRFWTNLSKPVVKKMSFVLVLQCVIGTFLSSRHFEIYLKMLRMPDSDSEQLNG